MLVYRGEGEAFKKYVTGIRGGHQKLMTNGDKEGRVPENSDVTTLKSNFFALLLFRSARH